MQNTIFGTANMTLLLMAEPNKKTPNGVFLFGIQNYRLFFLFFWEKIFTNENKRCIIEYVDEFGKKFLLNLQGAW